MQRSVPPPGTFDNMPDRPAVVRGSDGRFLTGNTGGGRPKGSRNRLTELLMTAIADDFATHGADAIARLRADDPANYLRMVAALVPRELILQRESQPVPDYAELSDEEAVALLEAEYRRRRLESAGKHVLFGLAESVGN
ncbi:hypothetical protein [Pseudogemmobacter bohemicus]|uniref:hypothetical protein n=1 Tax=Pseudogemmobacter bohemicus TaxID=2250708 RepID=UPI001E395EAD|nr:hypothetical protein [Pseudogemmobacter bohemicus]